MKSQQDIPVVLDTVYASQVPAILNELHCKLTHLINDQTQDSLDLRSLPLFPGDYQRLKQLLGQGEVSIKIDAMGPSEIYETRIAGIWWITHRNNNDEIVAECLEISLLPEILKSQQADIENSGALLQRLLREVID